LLFTSIVFCFVFLPFTVLLYYKINRTLKYRLGLIWLILASLVFYGYWNLRYIALLLSSVMINYCCGYLITKYFAEERNELARSVMIAGIVADLIILGIFKYLGFITTNLNYLGIGSFGVCDIILPLGISFFTFTQIAFLVDSYKKIVSTKNFISYLLFVTYFPHLLAGPILHYRDMMPQFMDEGKKQVDWDRIAYGLLLFTIGLFKKVVIADKFATWVTPGFGADYLTMIEAWAAALSYTFQIYFDFSGYTDMALGMSAMMNIRLPVNFNSPYKANSIIEFWKRWHITLSTFLKDYLYIPLGGNRKGTFRRYLNLLITMFLGGLWHGTAWTYVVWGLLHGGGLVVNHAFRAARLNMNWLMGRCLTFIFVVVAWVFFRAANFAQASVVLKGMVNWHGGYAQATLPQGRGEVAILLLFVVIVFSVPNSLEIAKRYQPNWWWTIATGLVLAGTVIYGFGQTTTFIYYQF